MTKKSETRLEPFHKTRCGEIFLADNLDVLEGMKPGSVDGALLEDGGKTRPKVRKKVMIIDGNHQEIDDEAAHSPMRAAL